jgi:hypothetical protein
VTIYLVKDGGAGTSSLTFAMNSSRILSQGRFFYRSTMTDARGYFFFSDLPADASYTIRPHLDTFTFEPSERATATGAVTTLFQIAAEEPVGPSCTSRNFSASVTTSDRKALTLQTYVLKTISAASTQLTKRVRDPEKRSKIENALSVAQAGTDFAYFEVMNESFAIPKVTVQCSSIPPSCVNQSYRSTVSKYRQHLLTLRRAGLYANRVASTSLSGARSSRNKVAREIKRLHRATLRATQRLPRESIECPSG